MSVFAVLLCPAKAQDTAQNYVKTVTKLNADGTDSLQAVQYYNGLGGMSEVKERVVRSL